MTQVRERRQQILDCAMAVIIRDGIGGLTIRKVAEAADVSTGLVLHHFASKEGLISDAWQLTLARLNERLGLPNEVEGIKWLDAVYRGRFEDRDESSVPWIFWLEYWLYAARTPTLRLHHSESYSRWRKMDLERINAGVEADEIRRDLDPDLIADMFHVVFCGLAVKAAIDHETISNERALELSRFFLSLLRPSTAGQDATSAALRGRSRTAG
jgi:AcrR family transcriptional regulator